MTQNSVFAPPRVARSTPTDALVSTVGGLLATRGWYGRRVDTYYSYVVAMHVGNPCSRCGAWQLGVGIFTGYFSGFFCPTCDFVVVNSSWMASVVVFSEAHIAIARLARSRAICEGKMNLKYKNSFGEPAPENGKFQLAIEGPQPSAPVAPCYSRLGERRHMQMQWMQIFGFIAARVGGDGPIGIMIGFITGRHKRWRQEGSPNLCAGCDAFDRHWIGITCHPCRRGKFSLMAQVQDESWVPEGTRITRVDAGGNRTTIVTNFSMHLGLPTTITMPDVQQLLRVPGDNAQAGGNFGGVGPSLRFDWWSWGNIVPPTDSGDDELNLDFAPRALDFNLPESGDDDEEEDDDIEMSDAPQDWQL